MLSKTNGIVLHHINYTESSVIAKIYTEQHGLQSYLIRGMRSSKSKTKISLLQHLSLVEVVAYHKKNSHGIKNIKEIKSNYIFQTLPYDIRKSTISLFINEIIYKSIQEEEANPALFNFLYHTIQILDIATENINDFHLMFMIQFTKYLGFFPQNNYSESNNIFNIQEGTFQTTRPLHNDYILSPLSYFIHMLMNTSFENIADTKLTRTQRRELLDKLIIYFRLHLTSLTKINSHLILQEVLD